MGQHLNAIIGKSPIDEARAKQLGLAIAYEAGFVIIILFEDSIYYWAGKLSMSFDSNSDLLAWDCDITHYFAAQLGLNHYAIVDVDYYNGSAFFIEGEKIMESNGINEALELLGVKRDENREEFSVINLGEYRNPETYYWDSVHNPALSKPNMIQGRLLKDD